MTSIVTQVEDIAQNVIDEIVAEAKALAPTFLTYAKEIADTLLGKFIAYVKETKLGAAIMNLISAANSSTASGYDKFAAVLGAAQAAWAAFVSAGGVTGVWAQFTSALVYVVQGLYESFIQPASAPAA